MRGYDSECNVHTNNITFARKFMHGINSLYKNNLNLPMCSFFSVLYWLSPPLLHHVVMLATSLRSTVFLFVFTEVNFVAQP